MIVGEDIEQFVHNVWTWSLRRFFVAAVFLNPLVWWHCSSERMRSDQDQIFGNEVHGSKSCASSNKLITPLQRCFVLWMVNSFCSLNAVVTTEYSVVVLKKHSSGVFSLWRFPCTCDLPEILGSNGSETFLKQIGHSPLPTWLYRSLRLVVAACCCSGHQATIVHHQSATSQCKQKNSLAWNGRHTPPQSTTMQHHTW